MASESDFMLGIAAAVADGAPIDWERAETQAASDDDRRVIRSLRLVAQMRACGTRPGDQQFFWYFQTPEGMSRDGDRQGSRGQLADPASTRRLCIDLQFTSASNADSETVGLITVRAIEGRVGFPLERQGFPWWVAAFEPSVAAGTIRFQGDAFNEWRLTLSPEITLKPLKFIRPERGRVPAPNKRGDWRGLIEVAYGAVLISPSITNEDLRVPFLEPFEHGWLRRAVLFRVNASELVGLR